jgi:ABC-type uncharacterized transport system permease subunit
MDLPRKETSPFLYLWTVTNEKYNLKRELANFTRGWIDIIEFKMIYIHPEIIFNMKITNLSKSASYRLKEGQIILGGIFYNVIIGFVIGLHMKQFFKISLN